MHSTHRDKLLASHINQHYCEHLYELEKQVLIESNILTFSPQKRKKFTSKSLNYKWGIVRKSEKVLNYFNLDKKLDG